MISIVSSDFFNDDRKIPYFELGELEFKQLPKRPSVKGTIYDLKTTYWVNQLHRDFKRGSYQLS